MRRPVVAVSLLALAIAAVDAFTLVRSIEAAAPAGTMLHRHRVFVAGGALVVNSSDNFRYAGGVRIQRPGPRERHLVHYGRYSISGALNWSVVTIPLWNLWVPLGAAAGVLAGVVRPMRRRRRRAEGRCASCGYSLGGLAGDAACPECGHRAKSEAPKPYDGRTG